MISSQPDRLPAGAGVDRAKACKAQDISDELHVLLVVIDDEHKPVHCVSSAAGTAG
jgi:hypothetical protein